MLNRKMVSVLQGNAFVFLALSLMTSTVVSAQGITFPFQPGQPIRASEMNDRFQALEAAPASVSSRGFQSGATSGTPNCTWVLAPDTSRGFFASSGESGCRPVAGIQLQHGSTPTELSCGVFHGEEQGANFMFARLTRNGIDDFSSQIIMETARSTSTGRQVINKRFQFEQHTVDNTKHVYYIEVLINNSSAGDRMSLVGCSVK